MPTAPHHLAALTEAQRAELLADPELATAFEAGLAPYAPKPVGVSWSGLSGETWVPVAAVFANAQRTVRWARQAQQVAA